MTNVSAWQLLNAAPSKTEYGVVITDTTWTHEEIPT